MRVLVTSFIMFIASSFVLVSNGFGLAPPDAVTYGSLPSERYIATNRFKVRKGAGPKFEKRWADRKSRLAQLNGFKFFTLLRRVDFDKGGEPYEGELANYVSCTVWQNRDNFNEWRTGDAFKEAHGGGGMSGFLELIKTVLFIVDGGPKPAFYEGIRPSSTSPDVLGGSKLVAQPGSEGWRDVPADGENFIAPDV